MRPGTGQGGREDPGEPGPNLRQRWPLLLLGLALVTHGLVHPTAAPQSRALGPGAPGGSSRSYGRGHSLELQLMCEGPFLESLGH
nr:immunoglobulin lambda-like polypeptide 1 [Chlorocebus sabaeus]